MQIAALVDSPDHVCARYRLRAFQPALAAAGHVLHICQIEDGWFGRKATPWTIPEVDVIVLQRRLLSRVELALLRRKARALWYDVDDAVWRRNSYASNEGNSRKLMSRFRNIVRSADMVLAGNPFLAQAAWGHGAEHTIIVPTCVDVSKYPVARHQGRGATMVWVGSKSTLRGLKRVVEMLDAIGDAIPGAKLKLVCDQFLKLHTLPVDEVNWAEASEADEIASADIGISWVPDDDWSRGKCGLKVLQYMAAGLPVIANPVGVHPDMVLHGKTGFLASTTQEWIEAVDALAKDPDLRQRMGEAGRKVAHDRFGVEVGAAQWLKLCQAFSSRPAPQ